MIENEWLEYLKPEFSKPYYKELFDFVKNEYATKVIYPPSGDIFSALDHTSIKDVKIVLLGQDPYHEEGQAHGMSFSVRPGDIWLNTERYLSYSSSIASQWESRCTSE